MKEELCNALEGANKRNREYREQIERLQEQLNEANEVIENMKLCMDDKYDYDCVAEDVDVYREKWGVK